MFKAELVNANTLEKRSVSFFEDDTIETVRMQISKSVDIHHDKLFSLVAIQCSRNYYLEDPRRWEALFNRISLNGMPIEKEIFQEYCSTYRVPQLSVPYRKIDKSEWMLFPEELRDIFEPPGNFIEYRILGVEESRSYCLPFQQFNTIIASRIISAELPVPDNTKLFLSLYKLDNVKGFLIKPKEEGIEGAYFPFFRTSTPTHLSEDQIVRLDTFSNNLLNLLKLDPPPPKSVHILKASWFAELVDTDFGDAVRNKFEQIFYGLTVSESVPCITFFTGNKEVSRHKFYTQSVKTKSPFLELPVWSSWWTKSKPARNRPTLVLYRGSNRENYDRVSISSSDIAMASYRDSKNEETISEMQDKILQWITTFDAITPFVQSSDIEKSRIRLQEIRYEAVYANQLEEIDTRRMNCISGIFDKLRTHQTVFRFLRTDYANDGLTSTDIRILDLLKDNPLLKPTEIEQDLSIPLQEASKLLNAITLRLQDDPWLLTKRFSGFPLFDFRSTSVVANAVTDIDRSLKYLNILQYILSNPVSKELDKICPKRMEVVEPIISTVNTDFTFDDTTDFENLFDYVEKEEEVAPTTAKPTSVTRTSKQGTMYKYFLSRLQEFDPETFDPSGPSEYAKKCDQGHQPIVLSENELSTILKEYDPRENLPSEKILELEDPNGIVVCPEYWCMYDKIPLQETQLIKVDGVLACPVCNGKIRNLKDSKSDTREYSVIQRPNGVSFPKYSKYMSPKNNKNLPCCFRTAAKEKKLVVEEEDQKYYIVSETKTNLKALRFAYLSKTLIEYLHLPETYALLIKSSNRIQSGLSGYFRVGAERPSETLPILFGSNVKITSPRENINWLLKCSFISCWTSTSDTNLEEINKKLEEIKQYKEDSVAREHMAKIISGIDLAFENGTLTQLQELEYCALIMRIDIFRINTETTSLGCTFYTQQTVTRKTALIVLQNKNEIDYLCHVVRTQRKFEYRANIYEAPFLNKIRDDLQKIRKDACSIGVPSFASAVVIIEKFLKEYYDTFSIILDPFGRAQAFYYPNKFILPFKNTPFPDIPGNRPLINGYTNIRDNLPSYVDMRTLLENVKNDYPGYEIERDLHDSLGNISELLLVSGLRVPIIPEGPDIGKHEEVMHTVMENTESELVFGTPDAEDLRLYKEISYASELFEFLIYQLTKDLQLEDYAELRHALSSVKPTKKQTEYYLDKWFNKTIFLNSLDTPLEFLSKVRTPCGQYKNKKTCEDGHMCGWTQNQCRIEVRNTFSKTKLFNKLFATLLDNSKIRYMVLDGKTTPFFSTILYLELPTEVILTDSQIKGT